MSRAKFNRCSLQVRDLPLEAFRLPRDGRKWKQLARSRYGLLLEISMYANGDGTFLSADAKINFSPSAKKLLRHRTKDTLYRLANDLRELGLLSWHRQNHYGRRFYWIQLSGNQVRYSLEIRSDIQNIRSDEQDLLSGPTSSTYPSLEPPSGGSPGSPPPVSGENQFYGKGARALSHHHQSSHNRPETKADDDDERARSQNPEQVIPESAEDRQRRLKDSAFQQITAKHGNRFPADLVRERLDDFQALAKTAPNSVNFYLTAFERDIPTLEIQVALEEGTRTVYTRERINKLLPQVDVAPSLWEQYRGMRETLGYPIVSGHDEIHVIAELYKLRNEGQSPTEVLKQAIITSSYKLYPVKNKNADERKSEPIPNAPPPVEPPSDNSGITWDEVEDLVFYAERYRANATQRALERGWTLVHKKIVRFQKHIGEFRTPKERDDFASYVMRLKGEQKARDAARIRKNEQSRERYKNKAVSHDEYTRADGASAKT
jgi:hypothetical protein